jgi:hypothetical protein
MGGGPGYRGTTLRSRPITAPWPAHLDATPRSLYALEREGKGSLCGVLRLPRDGDPMGGNSHGKMSLLPTVAAAANTPAMEMSIANHRPARPPLAHGPRLTRRR